MTKAPKFSEASCSNCKGGEWEFNSPEYLCEHSVMAVKVDPPRTYRLGDGYGPKVPSSTLVTLADNRTRRVYVANYGNAGSAYVIVDGKSLRLRHDDIRAAGKS